MVWVVVQYSSARGPGFNTYISVVSLSLVLVNTQEAVAPSQHDWDMQP